mgnify:CR=1 FL=1
MESIYRINDNLYKLVHKTYDDDLFGAKVYELLESKNELGLTINSAEDLSKDLNKLSFCTFRGAYNLKVIHFLEDNNFRFVDDFLHLRLKKKEYNPFKISSAKNVTKVLGRPSDNIIKDLVDLEKSVHDFSTFQADYRIENNISAERNALRVKSYFNNPNHLIYLHIDPKSKEINGFHQCVKGVNHVLFTNTAVKKINQSFDLVGLKLFAAAHEDIFKDSDINFIDSGCGFNNKSSLRLHLGFNYSIYNREIHFRKIKN